MFHIVRKMEEHTTNDIFHELDRTDKTVLEFVHEVQDALADDPEFDLSGVCEADEIYVVAGEKGLEQDDPRDRALKKRTRNLRVRRTATALFAVGYDDSEPSQNITCRAI